MSESSLVMSRRWAPRSDGVGSEGDQGAMMRTLSSGDLRGFARSLAASRLPQNPSRRPGSPAEFFTGPGHSSERRDRRGNSPGAGRVVRDVTPQISSRRYSGTAGGGTAAEAFMANTCVAGRAQKTSKRATRPPLMWMEAEIFAARCESVSGEAAENFPAPGKGWSEIGSAGEGRQYPSASQASPELCRAVAIRQGEGTRRTAAARAAPTRTPPRPEGACS